MEENACLEGSDIYFMIRVISTVITWEMGECDLIICMKRSLLRVTGSEHKLITKCVHNAYINCTREGKVGCFT